MRPHLFTIPRDGIDFHWIGNLDLDLLVQVDELAQRDRECATNMAQKVSARDTYQCHYFELCQYSRTIAVQDMNCGNTFRTSLIVRHINNPLAISSSQQAKGEGL